MISLPLLRHEQREVKANAHLTLGLIYYELGYYQEAIAHLRHIKEENRDHPQALLTRSWGSIKMNDFQNAVVTLNALVEKYDASEFGEEAHFLLGQSYLKLEFYDFAVKEYDYIIARYPEGENISDHMASIEAGTRNLEGAVEKSKVRLLVLESKLIDAISFDKSNNVPKYIVDHYQQLQRSQDQLIAELMSERKYFEQLSNDVERFRSELVRKESRRHWRAYAEYGKARALFLKGMPKQN
ncbi:MAG: tetratricopeptide repeat protein [bacterium]